MSQVGGYTAPFFRQQFFNSFGQPLGGGRIEFYSAGSAVPKAVYAHKDLSGSLGNVLTFDAGGSPVQYFMSPDGEYDIKIYDQFNVLVANPLRIDGGSGTGNPFPDPTNPGFLYWDGATYSWKEVTTYPDPNNSGYLHYDVGTGTYSWVSLDNITGDHKVMVDQFDTHPDYLTNKIVDGDGIVVEGVVDSTRYLRLNSMGKLKVDVADTNDYLNVKFQDTSTVNWSVSNHKMQATVGTGITDALYKVKSLGTDTASYLYAKFQDADVVKNIDANGVISFTLAGEIQPHGLAGGDLTGYYPDPLVKELSGLGVSWGSLDAKYTNGNPFIPGWGVLSLSFKTAQGFGLLISEYGNLYVTKDGGLTWVSAGYSISSGGTTRDIEYGQVTATNTGWAAIGNNSVYFFEDIPANYDGNGIPLQSAWVSGGFSITGADIAYSSTAGKWLFAEQLPGMSYCQYLNTGTITVSKVIPSGSGNNVGGIFVESNTGRIVYFERGTGRVWWAEANNFNDAADWTEVLHGTTPILKSIYPQMADNDGVGAGVSMGGTSAFAGNVVICTTNVADEASYMMGFDRGTLPSLWNITTDGINWFGTTVDAVDPCIYQLWIGSIPAHRQFIAEKGAVVYGKLTLPDLANAPYLGTDAWGNVVAKSAPSGASGDGYACTMQVANAIQTLAPNLISRSELITLFVPFSSQRIYQGSQTKFGCFMSQGGTGQLRFTLRDEQYRIIAASYYTTNPTSQVFLQLDCGEVWDPATHTSVPTYDLEIGGRYYLGILWDANGIQMTGDDAVQTVNTSPLPALKVDNLASMAVLTQLTGGSESKMRPFVRVLTKVA